MHHLIIGYGYCGYYLAQKLLAQQQEVTAVSRHLEESMQLEGLNHLTWDILEPFHWSKANTSLHYLIPPSLGTEEDQLLETFLAQSSLRIAQIIYYGSSGVYGDHQGAWVREKSPCHINSPRQKRRLNAEKQWLKFVKNQNIKLTILRIAGIFGPKRLPLEQAKLQTALIRPEAAPYINHIYIKDLANIGYQLTQSEQAGGIYNIADGEPQLMGSLQKLVASELGLAPAPYESFQEAWEKASPMKREFMQASKRLRIEALTTTLKQSLSLTPFTKAVKESLEGI